MGPFLDRLFRLWSDPTADEADFREMYADPVMVNGIALSVPELVARARALQSAYADIRFEIVDEVRTEDRLVVGFRMNGRHVGPLATPIGTVPPTDRVVENRATDILTLSGRLITDVWVVSDDLSVLAQLDAVALR